MPTRYLLRAATAARQHDRAARGIQKLLVSAWEAAAAEYGCRNKTQRGWFRVCTAVACAVAPHCCPARPLQQVMCTSGSRFCLPHSEHHLTARFCSTWTGCARVSSWWVCAFLGSVLAPHPGRTSSGLKLMPPSWYTVRVPGTPAQVTLELQLELAISSAAVPASKGSFPALIVLPRLL